MAEPIKMPFGMMSGLGPRNSVLHGVIIPKKKRQFGGKTSANKPNTPNNCEFGWSMQ